ncbi:group II intron reverse transcriptase/maturase, partial [Streptomyces sp. NPDC055722]
SAAPDPPRPLQPPVTQRDIEAEVAHCVGGVISPVLSNIYLHKLDEYVENVLIPQYTRGEARKRNLAYTRVKNRMAYARKCGRRDVVKQLRKQLRQLSVGDPNDPGYRRLRYSRYADDHLLGFIGPKAEAQEIKDQLARFLHEELKLNLSPEKTLITHARTRAARFLGYEITTQMAPSKIVRGQRAVNGKIALRVPLDVIRSKCTRYRKHGRPWHRSELQNHDDYTIVKIFGSEYRGIVQYYLLANDVWRFKALRWVAQTSMLKTLAAKHGSSVKKMAARFRATVMTSQGPRRCYEARIEREGRQSLVARFDGIPLTRQKYAVLTDRRPGTVTITHPRKELVTRLLAGRCELCDERAAVSVHQVRSLADLGPNRPGQPGWAAHMARKRRKTLVVCPPCHDDIHTGNPPPFRDR